MISLNHGLWKKHVIILIFSMIILLYLLPTFIQVKFDSQAHVNGISFGLPGVLSGDEPHYFVVTTSLINDHDFFIENNYDNAFFLGTCDVGERYRNASSIINRHVLLFNPEKPFVASLNSHNLYNQSTYSAELAVLYVKYNTTNFLQINQRPLGLSLFSALFLWPLKETCFIEFAAIYLTLLISLLGVLFFYLIARYYITKYKLEYSSENVTNFALLFTCIFALATPFWHYSKTYFPEPYLVTFLIIAYYFFFIKKSYGIPGLVLGIGFLMKYPFGMYLPLFGIFLLYKKQWKQIISFIMGSTIPFMIFFYINWILTRNIFYLPRTSYLSLFDNYIAGIVASLFDPVLGIIPFAPFLVCAFFGVWILYKKDKETTIQLLVLSIPFFLFWSSLALTIIGTGSAYSGRYFVPLLWIGVLYCLIWYIHTKNDFLKKVFWILVMVGVLINIQAAFFYFLFWNNPP